MITMHFFSMVLIILVLVNNIIVGSCLGGSRKEGRESKRQTKVIHEVVVDEGSQEGCPVTVWVHGTRLFPMAVLRRFFMTRSGLTHISKIDPKYHINRIGQSLSGADAHQFPKNNLYRFGWSGTLSSVVRQEAADELYTQLCALTKEWREKKMCEPIITLITHSHGGNVALNLAKIHKNRKEDIHIARLILLACPVQQETAGYVDDPLFEKVYSFYSTLDMIQIVDPQGLHKGNYNRSIPFFSERCFKEHTKLKQAKIKLNGRGMFHAEFMFPHFLVTLPSLLDIMDEYNPSLIHISTRRKSIKIDVHTVDCLACRRRRPRRAHTIREVVIPMPELAFEPYSWYKKRRMRKRSYIKANNII